MDGYQIKEDLLVPASEGIATIVEKGDCLEIIDVEGKQVGDMMAWVCKTNNEWFSPAHTLHSLLPSCLEAEHNSLSFSTNSPPEYSEPSLN